MIKQAVVAGEEERTVLVEAAKVLLKAFAVTE